MKRQQVQAEWRRAQKSIQAVELLQQSGLAEDAISRAYYALMHAAKAALLVHDVIVESHAAMRRLSGQVLVMAEGWSVSGLRYWLEAMTSVERRTTMWISQ